jgi:uncharacterized protein YbgA (DUF1722 family)/uncharacterized protein YbbK (DUF523 family)
MARDRPAIRIGVSSCLLGEEVRYDGGHERDDFLVRTVGPLVEWVPVCPEVGLGLGTPRETIRLVQSKNRGLRLLGSQSQTDHTVGMRRYSHQRSAGLLNLDLSGYVFKKGSPSCGVFRVKVYDTDGTPRRVGRGMFAQAVTDAMPLLPVEEEGRLRDAEQRDNFFERLFAYRRVTNLFTGRWRRGDLVRFHTAEKMLLLAHDRPAYTQLGRIVAKAAELDRGTLARRYAEMFMSGLAKIATTRKQTNVLQHMAGHLKRRLGADERAELAAIIEDYRRGLLPVLVPITLIRHHVRRLGADSLAGQTYLERHPDELMLRNHA